MTTREASSCRLVLQKVVLASLVGSLGLFPADAAAAAPGCDPAAVARHEAEFQRLKALHRFNPAAVSVDDLRAASFEYLTGAEACYQGQYGSEQIDEGGLTLGTGIAPSFSLGGTKWGSGSPFYSNGVDANGPRIPGGVVTYSFMASGIGGFQVEGGTPGTSLTLGALPTYAPCFATEIINAFAAWSAVANIQFVSVADGGQEFNAVGATADIRIVAHAFDGPSGVLAHAYYPPGGGGSSAPGDVHFDLAENWTCTPGGGGIDIGIVAAHEIGHAIGLNHESRYGAASRTALMNPFYNAALNTTMVLGDDINGAESIYGSAVGNSPDALVDFGPSYGAWILNYGVGWTRLHTLSPEETVTGDLDGNGIDEVIVDFGSAFGVWVRVNNATWMQLHVLSPTHMAVGDLDNSGRDDVVLDFTGYGVWRWMNNATWNQLHMANSTIFAIGNVDNAGGDDVVLTFPGAGVWRWMNNASWIGVHVLDADQILIGDFDETLSSADNADDIVLNFAGYGIFLYPNLGPYVQVHSIAAARMASGDLNRDGKDELVADFGPAYGIYILNYGFGWAPLHSLTSEGLTLGDLDGNGQAEVLIDFGSTHGLWLYVNNASWVQAHPLSAEGLAIGDLN